MPAHEIACLAPHGRCGRTIAQQSVDCRCQGADIAFGHEARGHPVGCDGADAARRRRDERRAGRHHLHHRVGKSIDVSRVIVHRRSNSDVGCRQEHRHDIVTHVAEKLHRVADTCGAARARSDASRSPSPAMATRSRGCCAFSAAAASIKYSNPFFLTRRPTARTTGTLSATPRISRPRARQSASGLNRSLSTP